MKILNTYGIYIITAIFEIIGCYTFMKWSRNIGDFIWLIVSLVTLIIFAFLLTFHDEASGRVYAAYGGIYIATAIAWLYFVDGIKPNIWDISGVLVVLIGVSIILFQPK